LRWSHGALGLRMLRGAATLALLLLRFALAGQQLIDHPDHEKHDGDQPA
jgi:hypothetical protein